MTTARLPYEIEQKLEAASKAQGKPKSEFVREALAQYFDQEETGKSSWELGEPYFGRYASGEGDLSLTYKDRLKERIGAKRRPG
jgi:hypothetical protein